MGYQQYSVVRITKLNKQFSLSDVSLGAKVPVVGDKAAIVEVYKEPSLGYELECIDKNGITQWLVTFKPEDSELEIIYENT